MKISKYSCIAFLLFSITASGQTYEGPETGSVASGVVVTTDDFLFKPIGSEPPSAKRIVKLIENKIAPMYYKGNNAVFDNYVYVEDKNANLKSEGEIGTSFELHGFQANQLRGILGFLHIPPDNHMAVGPNHVITTVNTEFSIWDRDGNLVLNIFADNWTEQVLPNPGAFDPQIIYDHYEQRWFMLWNNADENTQTGNFLISYSDDADPLGTWYMYALDATVNGSSPSSSWPDYPQIGYDDQAIYIMSRQVSFAGGIIYNKIRILNKSELYASNAGPLSWTDLWDISRPSDHNFKPDVIHPTISYDADLNAAFFVWSYFYGADFYILYVIEDPITNPVLTGFELPVPAYSEAPLANQLGGGEPRIETGGSRIRNAPVVRDGNIYAVHSIGNSQDSNYASLKYFVVDINTISVVEQVEQGAQGYFYFYPAIAVDQDHNLAITYSRSADTEYAGAYYSTKLGTDPPGLSQSKVMKEGEANYFVTFGGTRNRWGDYLSAALDPVNQYNIWLFSEYASDDAVHASGTWSTWLTEIRMKPYSGAYVFTDNPSLEFGNIELNSTSNSITAILANYGDQDLVITDIPSSVGDFNLDTTLIFPLTLSTYDSLSLLFTFSPIVAGDAEEIYTVDSNDPNFVGFTFSGFGYVINLALDKVMYASSGSQNEGNILSLNKETGEGTNIGPSSYNDILGLTISPLNNELYGVISTTSESQILRINSLGGDAYLLYSLDLGNMVAIAFDTSGTLYGALEGGDIYSIDLTDGSYQEVSVAPIEITAISFEPMTNDLWVTRKGGFGQPKDGVYKIDLQTGDTTTVGETGFNVATNDIAFDESGVLYGIKGTGPQVSDLFTIDVNTGEATIIGPVGLKALTGLAYAETGVVSVEKDENNNILPSVFVLSQNYPNPFNPTTSIEFSIPVNSNVSLIIYNLLGQVVTTLVNEDISAGNYSVVWNGADKNGLKVSSGVYLYKMQAIGTNGNEFQQIRKMVLLK